MDTFPGFEDFVAARSDALSRLAYLLASEHTAAEDLLQEALTKAATHWSKVIAADSPEAYVRRIMYHLAVSGWRKRRIFREHPVADATVLSGRAVPDETDSTNRRIVMRQALRRLTPRQRAVLVLRFYEDRSAAESALLLDCSVGTVKSQIHHALRRLRELAPELAELTEEV